MTELAAPATAPRHAAAPAATASSPGCCSARRGRRGPGLDAARLRRPGVHAGRARCSSSGCSPSPAPLQGSRWRSGGAGGRCGPSASCASSPAFVGAAPRLRRRHRDAAGARDRRRWRLARTDWPRGARWALAGVAALNARGGVRAACTTASARWRAAVGWLLMLPLYGVVIAVLSLNLRPLDDGWRMGRDHQGRQRRGRRGRRCRRVRPRRSGLTVRSVDQLRSPQPWARISAPSASSGRPGPAQRARRRR